jgi:predicted DNA-binding WGR domain protein
MSTAHLRRCRTPSPDRSVAEDAAMAIEKHVERFAGYQVVDYDPAEGIAAPAGAVAAPALGPRRREFQLVEGTSSKFWAIQLEGKAFEVTFGRIGTAGQNQRKEFKSAGEALKAHDKLIAEKVAKGYAEVRGPASPSPKPAQAQKTSIVYRVGLSTEEYFRTKTKFPDKLAAFLADPAVSSVPALVIGCWSHEGQNSTEVVEALVAARDNLPNLRALFLGDTPYGEQEISWIVQSDITALFDAYPELEHFRARGGQGLALGKIKHKHLQSLTLEASNLPAEVVRAVGASTLPALEHLELWLGTEEYGADTTVADLKSILSGKGFPALRYLGLRNSEIADAIAKALARAPVVARLRVLDLSLGTLSDQGARHLLAVPSIAQLEKLDIHHHYVSPEVVAELKAQGIKVDASDRQEIDADDVDEDEDDAASYRYIAHAE